MTYSYLDHEADIGIRCSGRTLGEAFEEGGRALFHLMADPEGIEPRLSLPLECRATGVDTLFVEYLNEILSLAGRKEAVFSRIEIMEISEDDQGYRLSASLHGEEIDPSRHRLKTEVKAATYFGLEFTESEDSVTLQCVLDI